MLKNNLKNFFLGFIFLLLNVLSFAEIPHSYVTENPKKEVQKVETFKQRDKTEMNLSVTKIKAKEVKDGNISYYTNSKLLKISLEKKLYNIEIDDKFLVSESGENIFSINRFKSKNSLKSNTKLCKINDNGTFKELSLDFENKPQEIFLTILDKNYNVKEVLKYKNIKEITDKIIRGETDLYLTENYDRGSERISFSNFKYEDPKGPQEIEFYVKPIGVSLKKISGYGLVQMKENDILIINDTQKIEVKSKLAKFDEVLVDTKVNSNNLKIKGDTYGEIILKEIINPKATVDKYSLKLQLLRENKIIMEHKFNIHTVLFNKIENHIKYEYDIENDFQENSIVDLLDYTIGLDERIIIAYKLQEETPTYLKLKEGEKLKKLIINNQKIIIEDENNYPSKILTLENNLKLEILKGKKLTFKILNYELTPFFITIEEETEINNEIINSKVEVFLQKKTFNKELEYKTDTKWSIEDGVYEGEWIENDYWNGGFGETWDKKGLGLRSWNSNHPAFGADALGNYSLLPLEDKVESLKINGITIPEAKGIQPEFKGILKISEDYTIEYRTKKGNPNIFTYRFIKYPKEDFKLELYLEFETYEGQKACHYYNSYYQYFPLIELNQILKGNSTLIYAEYYPVNEFVQFTANPTIQNALPLALDNSVRDVTLETTGKGLVAMQEGDKLTVDGHEVVIGAGGNIGPQKLTIGNVKYTYEVKNGKFRIALNEWGVLEPDRIIPIKIVRTENGNDKSLAEHNLTIKAPRRVEGTSNVKLNQDYDIRSIIKFNGISLKAPGRTELESTTTGVSLTSTAGQGIPFMKEGDRLEISDGLTTRSTYSTRGAKAFTIGPNGTLGKQQVKLNNGELTIFVEGGKLRVGVNNYLSNSIINAKLDLIRGTNEIMNHILEFKTPEAPFNIKKNGLLDFGNVTAGSKRTAETDIVLEMLKDVSDVKFSLKNSQPILENLDKSNNLKVNNITYLSENKEREYKVKLKGNLTIPEGTKSGLYTGSTILELQIK